VLDLIGCSPRMYRDVGLGVALGCKLADFPSEWRGDLCDRLTWCSLRLVVVL